MLSWLKPSLFAVCLIPLGQLAYRAYDADLGANPIDTVTRFTGSWALIFLLASLAVTPLRRITGRHELIKLRRMLGLYAFFYVLLHFSTFVGLDHFFDLNRIAKDILKRPYVTAGFTAFVMMIPLALTSTAGMIRRLGKRWQQLHRLVYLAAIAAVIHFYWLVKSDISRPAQYAAVLAVLLGYRLVIKWKPLITKQFSTRASTTLFRSFLPPPSCTREGKRLIRALSC
jgi:methionine sulfoxide reductase heme-binding subunit